MNDKNGCKIGRNNVGVFKDILLGEKIREVYVKNQRSKLEQQEYYLSRLRK